MSVNGFPFRLRVPSVNGPNFANASGMFALPSSLSWTELGRRVAREARDDDVLGLAAQLAYYFFLALFPSILFLLALASFFSLTTLTDDVARALGPFVSPEVLALIQDQMRRLADTESGGFLTVGVLGALWSSSAALVSIVDALNRAYDIEEGRPWWKVRLVAIALTIALAAFVLAALALVLAGPTTARYLGRTTGLGDVFIWAWMLLQWPVAFALVSLAIGIVYYVAPDADQDWVWVTPGALLGTVLWLLVSLVFKFYVARFTDYQASYGAIGGVILLMLWFYVSGVAILAGAEVNAEIEHASPYGKAPGEKSATGRRALGARAARLYEERMQRVPLAPAAAEGLARPRASRPPGPMWGFLFAAPLVLARLWRGVPTLREPRTPGSARKATDRLMDRPYG